MTDLTTEAVRAALEAATPGPWRVVDEISYGDRSSIFFQEIWSADTDILVTTECRRAHNDGGQANIRLIAMTPDLARAYLEQAAEIERLRKALRRHHDWHLAQDRDGAAWGIDPVDAYSESGLCEETVTALTAYRAAKEAGNE